MTHLSTIGAGMFTDLSVAVPAVDLSATAAAAINPSEAVLTAAFATETAAVGGTKAAGAFIRIQDIREFPGMGTPANLVNVPRFGARTSAQVQGQADNPNVELTLNYVAANWAKGADKTLGNLVGDGVARYFRVAMLNTQPPAYGSKAAELGAIPNSLFYFIGKLETLVYTPQLTDANQATLTISMISELQGAFTIDPA